MGQGTDDWGRGSLLRVVFGRGWLGRSYGALAIFFGGVVLVFGFLRQRSLEAEVLGQGWAARPVVCAERRSKRCGGGRSGL